jgi:glycerophosphoryl diester phosphodiesterase
MRIENLLETLEAASLEKGSVISGSDYNLLRELDKKDVQFPLILIVSFSKRQTVRQNFQNAVLCIAPGLLPKFLDGVAIHHRLVRKTFVNRLQGEGSNVFVWTVDDREDMEKFVTWRVDGVITNYPHRLQDIKRRWIHVPT